MLKLPELNNLLAYENPSIVSQYCKDNPEVSETEGQQIFKDLLAWIWLHTYRAQSQKETHMFGPLLKLDHMWHVFILNTRAYSQFCQAYLSGYLHHEVELINNEYVLSSDDMSDFLSDCYDHLGEAWVLRNFEV